MARKTSKEALKEITSKRLLPIRRLQVYEHLFRHGPATAQEVEKSFLDRGFGEGRHVNKRLPELREQGAVEEVGERKCEVTGQIAILWDVTSALPHPMPKKSGSKKAQRTYEIKECSSCLLQDEADDGSGKAVCWMNSSVECTERGRPGDCPLNVIDFVVRAG